MKKILLIANLLIYISLSSFAMQNDVLNFDNYKEEFTKRLWKQYPDWATGIGYHEYDNVLFVPNALQRTKEKAFFEQELSKLHSFSLSTLTDANKIDYKILEDFFHYNIFLIDTYKSWQWNPAEYNVGASFSYILSENYEPLSKRLNSFYQKLKNVPAYYTAAKLNIQHPTKEHAQLAIDQNEGTLTIFEKDFIDSVKTMHLKPAVEEAYLKRAEAAAKSIHSYLHYLKNYKNETPRSFRIGSDLYAERFKYEIQSKYTVDEIYLAAESRKQYLHDEMEKLAIKLWPKYFGDKPQVKDKLQLIKMVIDTISVQHVEPALFKQEIEKQLPELAAFVEKKNLIYLDPNKPLKVRNEPGYMAGVAGASMSSPGPYEKNGTSYYNVGTLDGWSAERSESYLREYNKYVLQILNIHEAIPGHYVQLVYSNKSPSIIKSILGNGAMIEGWAVYSELMMMENGYGNNEDEMWLMYYKWNLRTVCNTILDISVHTKDMSKEAALDLLINQAFQQQAEAEGKWKRVQVTSVQLTSYFTGFYEILQLREAYKLQKGAQYSVKEFNEKILSYGSAPVKYIAEMMLKK